MIIPQNKIPQGCSLPAQEGPPLWQRLLTEQRIAIPTIVQARIKPYNTGWAYPVHDLFTRQVLCRRWKQFPGGSGYQSLWLPQRPRGANWYSLAHQQSLETEVHLSDGVLYLASSEPEVWALHSAGIYNAACTLFRGALLHRAFVEDLQRLGVHTVRLFLPLSSAGARRARRVHDRLHGSAIALAVYTLPACQANLHATWMAYQGRAQDFEAWLLAQPLHPHPLSRPALASPTAACALPPTPSLLGVTVPCTTR